MESEYLKSVRTALSALVKSGKHLKPLAEFENYEMELKIFLAKATQMEIFRFFKEVITLLHDSEAKYPVWIHTVEDVTIDFYEAKIREIEYANN